MWQSDKLSKKDLQQLYPVQLLNLLYRWLQKRERWTKSYAVIGYGNGISRSLGNAHRVVWSLCNIVDICKLHSQKERDKAILTRQGRLIIHKYRTLIKFVVKRV